MKKEIKEPSDVKETKEDDTGKKEAKKDKKQAVFFIPTITKPPIFKSRKQLMTFFAQEEIAKLRPLGKIIGFVKHKKLEKPKPPQDSEKKDAVPKEKNTFWEMVGYKGPPPDEKNEEVKEMRPYYIVPSQFVKSLTHTGTMKRVRMNKEKSEYRQIITPCPDYTLTADDTKDSKKKIQAEKVPPELKEFESEYFGSALPRKLMVSDKSVKHLKETRVRFKVTGTWNEVWPMAKIVQIY